MGSTRPGKGLECAYRAPFVFVLHIIVYLENHRPNLDWWLYSRPDLCGRSRGSDKGYLSRYQQPLTSSDKGPVLNYGDWGPHNRSGGGGGAIQVLLLHKGGHNVF